MKTRLNQIWMWRAVLASAFLLMFSAASLLAQTREQMAIWDFGPNGASYTILPYFYGTVSSPVFTPVGTDYDSNGDDGPTGALYTYTDLRGKKHDAGQAVQWNDVKKNPPNQSAAWIVQIDTRTWQNLRFRLDYLCSDPAAPITGADIAYATSSSGPYTTFYTTRPMFTADNVWHSYNHTVNFPAAINNAASVFLRFTNMEAGSGNNGFRFDNFEISGERIVPAAPTGLTRTLGILPEATLSWSGQVGTDYYEVERQIGAGSFSLVGTATGTTYKDTPLSDNTAYTWRVRGHNSAGYSPYSGTTTYTTQPAQPTGVAAARVNSTTISVSWNVSAGANSYHVFRSAAGGSGGPYTGANTLHFLAASGVTSHNFASSGSGPYYCVVVATNTLATQLPTLLPNRNSAEAMAPKPGAGQCNQLAPATLTATPNNTPQVHLSWATAAGTPAKYYVRRSATKGGPYTTIATVNAPTTSYDDTTPSVADNTIYWYVVAADNNTCVSQHSPEAGARTAPVPPTSLTATPGNSQVLLSWVGSPDATSYTIRRGTSFGAYPDNVGSSSTTSFTDPTAANGTLYYYVVSAVRANAYPTVGSVEGRNSAAANTIAGYVLLNEISANPPGAYSIDPLTSKPDSAWEYIELRGTPSYNLANYRVVVINGSQAASSGRGVASLVVPLSGTIPPSGIVLIKQAGHPTPPDVLGITVLPAHRIPQGVNNLEDDLIFNDASTVFLTAGGGSPVAGTDYDNNNDGLDAAWYNLNQTIVDSVSWFGSGDISYGGAPVLVQANGQMDAATRDPANNTPNSAAAWWSGELIGAPSAVAYTSDPTFRSATFNANCFLTPGLPNEPAPCLPGACVNFIEPIGKFISAIAAPFEYGGDPFSSTPSSPYDIPLSTVGTITALPVIFNNTPVVFDNFAAHLQAVSSAGTWYLRLQPDNVAANRLVTLLPNGEWARARSFVFSSMFKHPSTLFVEGISDASTALSVDWDDNGTADTYPMVADDEQNSFEKYSHRYTGSAESQYFPNLNTTLGVTKEVDFESSARLVFSQEPSPGANAYRFYLLGGMGNSTVNTGFDVLPDRDRFLSFDINYTATPGNYDVVLRGWGKTLRTALSNAPAYAQFRLNESMRKTVDSKTKYGFNVEGLEVARDWSTMFIGLRAPLVPAPPIGTALDDPATRGNLALVVRLNNWDQITDAMDDQTAPVFGNPITLDLGGRGIRSILDVGNYYLILAGLPGTSTLKPGDFAIYGWDGVSTTPFQMAADLAGKNPEAMLPRPNIEDYDYGPDNIRLYEDNGAMDWYGGGGENKDHPLPLFRNLRKSRVLKLAFGLLASFNYGIEAPCNTYQAGYYAEDLCGGAGRLANAAAFTGTRALVGDTVLGAAFGTPDDAVLANGYWPSMYGGYCGNGTSHFPVYWYLYGGSWPAPVTVLDNYVTPGEVRAITPNTDYSPGNNTFTFGMVGWFQKAGGRGAFYKKFDFVVGAVTPHPGYDDLPALAGATHTFANAVDYSNPYPGMGELTIVGASGSSTLPKACFWKMINGTFKVFELPAIPNSVAGDASEALGINGNGTIVGYTYRLGFRRPCMWSPSDAAVSASTGYRAYELMGLSVEADGIAKAIDDFGQVVGTVSNGTGNRGCIWVNGQIADLNSRVTMPYPCLTANGTIPYDGIVTSGVSVDGVTVRGTVIRTTVSNSRIYWTYPIGSGYPP